MAMGVAVLLVSLFGINRPVMNTKHCHILYVDDEFNNIVVFESSFFKSFKIYTAQSAKEALSLLEKEDIHILITDQRMPEMSGIELLEVVTSQYPDITKMILTAYSDVDVVMQAVNKCGISQYILKPWDRRDLKMTIENAWTRHFLKSENAQLVEALKQANYDLEEKVKKRTGELNKKNERLMEINAFKDRLFSIISHDVRTPLLSLEVYLDMITNFQRALSVDKIETYSRKMKAYLQDLQALLDSLLQWSLVDGSSLEGKITEVDLDQIIKSAISINKASADQKNIEIDYKKAAVSILADVNMMHVVLRNLINNAIKFTNRDGSISIEVEAKDAVVDIAIKDTGIGIPQETLSSLFDSMQFISTKGTESENGVELGLKLCRELIALQSGKIAVESCQGNGTTFIVSVPQATSCQKTELLVNL